MMTHTRAILIFLALAISATLATHLYLGYKQQKAIKEVATLFDGKPKHV